jgi:choline-sulfatase
MYEESVGIPLIVAGPDIPEGAVEHRPASLLDLVPFILESVGVPASELGRDLPGRAILTPAFSQRPVISQYHATGSRTAAYMVRLQNWKYIFYSDPSYPSQFFDLDADPEEVNDLAGDERYREPRIRCHGALEDQLDPVAVDRLARLQQEQRVAELGGAEAIIARGDFGYSPPPGRRHTFAS